MIKDKYRRIAVLAAAVFSAANVMNVMGAETDPAPGAEYGAYMARLQDNQIDYDELTDLVKHYYGPIKSAYEMIDSMEDDQGGIAVAMRVAADDYISQADELADVLGGGNAAVSALKNAGSQLRSSAATMDRSISKSNSKHSVDRQVNMVVFGAETVMNRYEYYQSQRTMLAKALEIAQTAQTIQQTMQAQGLAVDADVLSAVSQLSSSKSQLESVDAGIDQMYKSLCYYTGRNNGNAGVIGQVPSADILAIASIDVNADKEKAVNNNYSLISMRGQSAAGMTDFQVRTSKSTTQTSNKLRNVEYSENTLRSDIQTLYDTILEKKAAYDSAYTGYQSAQLTWNAAQIQRQNGTLSQIQYMQQELAYLQAQSGFRCADLDLQQAMRNYDWAVKGVSVSAG